LLTPEKDKIERFAACYTMVDAGDCGRPQVGKTTLCDYGYIQTISRPCMLRHLPSQSVEAGTGILGRI